MFVVVLDVDERQRDKERRQVTQQEPFPGECLEASRAPRKWPSDQAGSGAVPLLVWLQSLSQRQQFLLMRTHAPQPVHR
jgi:hypothetical protein